VKREYKESPIIWFWL